MKHRFFFMFVILVNATCSSQLRKGSILKGGVFESKKGHVYNASKFIFNSDSSFVFYGQGPSVFLSKGTWQYNPVNKEISFISKSPDEKFVKPVTVDTLWVDISKKKAKVVTKRKIIFENISYFQK